MANLAPKAHQLLCSLNLHLWGRARRVTGVAGRSRTCLSCGQRQKLPVQTKADAAHAAEVATAPWRNPTVPPPLFVTTTPPSPSPESLAREFPLTEAGKQAERQSRAAARVHEMTMRAPQLTPDPHPHRQ